MQSCPCHFSWNKRIFASPGKLTACPNSSSNLLFSPILSSSSLLMKRVERERRNPAALQPSSQAGLLPCSSFGPRPNRAFNPSPSPHSPDPQLSPFVLLLAPPLTGRERSRALAPPLPYASPAASSATPVTPLTALPPSPHPFSSPTYPRPPPHLPGVTSSPAPPPDVASVRAGSNNSCTFPDAISCSPSTRFVAAAILRASTRFPSPHLSEQELRLPCSAPTGAERRSSRPPRTHPPC